MTHSLAIFGIPASCAASEDIDKERSDFATVCEREGRDNEDKSREHDPVSATVLGRRRIGNSTCVKQRKL